MKQIICLCIMSIALILSINSQSTTPHSSSGIIAPKRLNLVKTKFSEKKAAELKNLSIRFIDDIRTLSRHFYATVLCMQKDSVRKRQNKERESINTCIQRFAVRLEDDSSLCPHAEGFLEVLRDGIKRIRRYNNLSKTQGKQMLKKALNLKRKVFWDILEMTGSCTLVPDNIRKQTKTNIQIFKNLMDCKKEVKGSLKRKGNLKNQGTGGVFSTNTTALLLETKTMQPTSEPENKSRKQKAIEGKFYVRQLKLKKFFKKMERLLIRKSYILGGVAQCKDYNRVMERIALKKSAKLIGLLLAKITYLAPYDKRPTKTT